MSATFKSRAQKDTASLLYLHQQLTELTLKVAELLQRQNDLLTSLGQYVTGMAELDEMFQKHKKI